MPFAIGLPSALAVFLAADFTSQLIIAFSALITVALLVAIRKRGKLDEANDLPLFHDILFHSHQVQVRLIAKCMHRLYLI